jgi:hypothetical protein
MSKELTTGLRQLAGDLRKQAVDLSQAKTIKCAKVLTAAKGFLRFKEIFGGKK